jgi:anti-anti-sigma factor
MTAIDSPRDASGLSDDMTGFSLEIRREAGGTVVVLTGSLDDAAAPTLRTAIDDLHIGSDGDVTLDLSGLTFLDSGGLGCLFRLHQRVADGGGLVTARGCAPAVRRVMQMVQLHRVIALID